MLLGFGTIIFARNAVDAFLGAAFPNDEGGKFATLDASGVQPFGVSGQLQAAVGIVAVDDGRARFFGKEGLVFIP